MTSPYRSLAEIQADPQLGSDALMEILAFASWLREESVRDHGHLAVQGLDRAAEEIE